MKEGTYFTASVYIVHENKVLVHKHKKFDLVIPVGGYLEGSELPEEAVVREAKEETGLDIILHDPYPSNLNDDKWTQANAGVCLARIESRPGIIQYDFTFFATVDDLAGLGTGELAMESIVFMSTQDLAGSDIVAPNVVHYASQAIDLLGK